MGSDVIPNQVFIGLPWKNVKQKYEHAVDALKRTYPLAFVIVGRESNQDAEELLDIIKRSIDSSSYAVFDGTQGNANVSLEYGYAEAQGIKKALYFCTRKSPGSSTRDHAIISDLAGKRRNHWTTEGTLLRLLKDLAESHPYSRRFDRFTAQRFKRLKKGVKRRSRTLALKIIHELDGKGRARRTDVVQELQADINQYGEKEIERMIGELKRAKLILSEAGRYSSIAIR